MKSQIAIKIEKVLEELLFDRPQTGRFIKSKEQEQRIGIATLALLKIFDEAIPKELLVMEENKSPAPDILNDCEVRREGWNDCIKQIRQRLGE